MKERLIIWSLDPFQENTAVWKNSLKLVSDFAKALKADILPVYVANPSEVRLSLAFDLPPSSRLKVAAERALSKRLKGIHLPGLQKPKILVDQNLESTKAMTKSLSKYALNLGADLILVGTQSKKGMSRLFLGSFAETLLFQAKTPVLLVGPQLSAKGIKKILFPTDFSHESNLALKTVAPVARALKARIELYHAVSMAPTWAAGADPMIMAEASSYLRIYRDRELSRAQKFLSRFKKVLSKHRVACDTKVETTATNLGTGICDHAARSRASMIALASESSHLSAQFLGSVARTVIRHSSHPVWVFRR